MIPALWSRLDRKGAAADSVFPPWSGDGSAHLNCISHLLSQIPYEDLTGQPETGWAGEA